MPEQLLERRLPFTVEDFAPSSSISSKFIGGAMSELDIHFSATPGGAPASPSADAMLKMLGTVRVEQFTDKRIQADARSLYFLAAIYNGGLGKLVGTTTVGAVSIELPFSKIINDGGIDATGVEAFIKADLRALAYYSGTAPTSLPGKIRPQVTSRARVPEAGLRLPNYVEESHALTTVSSNIPYRKDVDEAGSLPGILLIALNADGSVGTDASSRVDGLVRRLKITLNMPDSPNIELVDERWEQLRARTQRLAGWSDADQAAAAGVVWIPTRARANVGARQALFVPGGSSFNFQYDTSEAVSDDYTSVAPAAGDKVLALFPFHLPNSRAAGSERSATMSPQEPTTRAGVRSALVRSGGRGGALRSRLGF